MPHDRKRHGTLTNAQTYEARYGEKRSVREIAQAEGVTEAAIFGRLAAERKRRQAAGEVVHRTRKGRRRVARKRVLGEVVPVETAAREVKPLTTQLLLDFTKAVVNLEKAVARL